MIRKALLVSALAAGALIGTAPAQASAELATVGGLIDQLQSDSTFSANNQQFSICQNGTCQTLFTGVTGLRGLNLAGFNSWANLGSYQSASSPWDDYRFTFSGATSYFGNQSQSVPPPPQTYAVQAPTPTMPVPEPATWAMMIFGFGVIGYAMRSRPVVINFG